MRIRLLNPLKKTISRWLLTLTVLLSLFSLSGTPTCTTSVKSQSAKTELLVNADFKRNRTVSYFRFTATIGQANQLDILFPPDFILVIRFQNQRAAITALYATTEPVNAWRWLAHQKVPSTPEDSSISSKG